MNHGEVSLIEHREITHNLPHLEKIKTDLIEGGRATGVTRDWEKGGGMECGEWYPNNSWKK
jgi:hypothetical protein